MNSRNPSDNVFDLSLERSLKNWVDRKNPPVGGRAKLLAAAAKQEASLPRIKTPKNNFDWLFRLDDIRCEYPFRPITSHQLEYIDFLKTRMAFL